MMRSCGEVQRPRQNHHLSYKQVPWLSWEEWKFVRKSLFSSSSKSVTAGVNRVSTWRARGHLPVAVEVTTAIIETQQKDPYFRVGHTTDTLNSSEILAMSYCMAIMRLVNGFLDKACKEANLSFLQSAEAIGIPRVLVDIRHEGSHCGLPSLPLLRSASIKALNWLKANYWEPQRKLIPNVRKETKSKMREMILYLNGERIGQMDGSVGSPVKKKRVKNPTVLFGRSRLLSHVALRCSKQGASRVRGMKRLNGSLGSLIRTYSVFPLEVVAALLEFPVRTFDSLDSVKASESSDVSQVETKSSDSKSRPGAIDDWKAIITKMARKEPALLLTMLEEALAMIEERETKRFEMGTLHLMTVPSRSEIRQIECLSSLVLWFIEKMTEVKKSRRTQLNDLSSSDAIPSEKLTELLRRCLLLLTPGNSNLLDSALLLANIMGKKSIIERLKKLPLQAAPDPDQTIEDTGDDFKHILQQEEDYIKQAAKKLEHLKSCLLKGNTVTSDALNGESDGKLWGVAKSWTKCPIGMLPRAFGSSGILPVLERNDIQCQEYNKHNECKVSLDNRKHKGKRKASFNIELSDNPSLVKKIRDTTNDELQIADGGDELSLDPIEGQLLIGGIWRKVEEGELAAIESGLRILV